MISNPFSSCLLSVVSDLNTSFPIQKSKPAGVVFQHYLKSRLGGNNFRRRRIEIQDNDTNISTINWEILFFPTTIPNHGPQKKLDAFAKEERLPVQELRPAETSRRCRNWDEYSLWVHHARPGGRIRSGDGVRSFDILKGQK